jgi:hypothetical protein
MDVYLIAVGCVAIGFAIGFAIGCPFGVGAAMWGMMDWQNGRRERIAARAMQGLLANPEFREDVVHGDIAKIAVEQADCLAFRLDANSVKGGSQG